jgi:hypothetical protein
MAQCKDCPFESDSERLLEIHWQQAHEGSVISRLVEASKRPKPITTFTCGPGNAKCKCDCPDNCEHKWDGPTVEIGRGGWSVSCSRCGMAAIDHDTWVGP